MATQKKQNLSVNFVCRFSPNTRDRIETAIFQSDESMASFIRAAVRDRLKKIERKNVEA